jgi:hypothetical protein
MRNFSMLVIIGCFLATGAGAQQKLIPGMNFIPGTKPNNIIYHDTLYRGAGQFMQLFYRTQNPELIRLYAKHQSNKITGNIISFVGTIATIVGVSKVSGDNKGLAWGLIGGGFAATLTGGYLIFRGQQHLESAVNLFNYRYNRASLGIGVGDRQAGLVYKF